MRTDGTTQENGFASILRKVSFFNHFTKLDCCLLLLLPNLPHRRDTERFTDYLEKLNLLTMVWFLSWCQFSLLL